MLENTNGKAAGHLLGVFTGLVCIIFHRAIGIHVVQFQKQYFGKDYSIRAMQVVYLLMGVVFVVGNSLAILSLLEIIKFK